jgi:hypothetical protein
MSDVEFNDVELFNGVKVSTLDTIYALFVSRF